MPALAAIPNFAVQATADLRRIAALPRRVWDDGDAAALAERMTAILRTPTGTMTLRPIQAVALLEAGMHGGLFGPIRVGGGKTILTLLAPNVMDSRRPLLLVPAKLARKTEREQKVLITQWRIPNFIRIVSYELLGRPQAVALLEQYEPDLIVMDECHRLKNPAAAVTKRVMRYLDDKPTCRLVALSGTVTKRSIRDYAHLLRRAVVSSPVPARWNELEQWANALDERPKTDTRLETGALVMLCDADEARLHASDPLLACRRAYRRRLTETPGVVATTEGHEGASLSVTAIEPRLGSAVDKAFAGLRLHWVLPNGRELVSGLEKSAHARELALGFFYVWADKPPAEWLKRRREWGSCLRYILKNNRRDLDSSKPVTDAVAAGQYPRAIDPETDPRTPLDLLLAWQAIEDTYEPKTLPMWIDDGAIQAAAAWMKEGPGIVWCEHQAFANRLASITGRPYYAKKGMSADGRSIPEFGLDADCGKGAIIASRPSNAEGRNLQGWSRNLVVSPSPSGEIWEQLIGRCDRPGQEADEVSIEVFVGCLDNAEAMAQARRDAMYIESTLGQAQKILHADWDVPSPERGGLR